AATSRRRSSRPQRCAAARSTRQSSERLHQREDNENSGEQQGQRGKRLPERRGMILRIARGGVGERIQRKREGPPCRAVRPAQEIARNDEQRRREREAERIERLQEIRARIEREAVRID